VNSDNWIEKEFTKDEVELQVASVKSPILHLQRTDEGKSTKGPFDVCKGKSVLDVGSLAHCFY